MAKEIFQKRVSILPSVGKPGVIYYIENGNGTNVDQYLADNNGLLRLIGKSEISSYVHTQGVASTIWYIKHNMKYYPNVSIVDSGGSVMIGNIQYIDNNNIIATFSNGFSGNAYLS